MKIFIYIFSCLPFSLSCGVKDILRNSKNNEMDIYQFIKVSESEIFEFLKKSNFPTHKYKSTIIMNYFPENKIIFCHLLNLKLEYSDFIKSLDTISLFTTAYFIDNNKNLFAQSSNHTLISNTFTLSYNELNQKIALKALENNYSAYIILKCQNKMIIGFNNKVVDVFLLKNEELYLKSSVQNIY